MTDKAADKTAEAKATDRGIALLRLSHKAFAQGELAMAFEVFLEGMNHLAETAAEEASESEAAKSILERAFASLALPNEQIIVSAEGEVTTASDKGAAALDDFLSKVSA